MFLLRSHLICLFVELLYIDLFRTDVALKLLDFVVQNELKLFELLDFLLQLADLNVLFLNSRLPGFILFFTRRDLTFNLLLLLHNVFQSVLFLFKLLTLAITV